MKENLIKRIDRLFNECSKIGWDGYDGVPLKKELCDEAIRFVKLLTNIPDILLPFIAPESDGGIGFEWETHSGDMALLMGIDEVGKINYCVWYESESIEDYRDDLIIDFNKEDSIPKEILEAIYIIDERNKITKMR